MDEGARRWLIKTAKKNYWRVSRWYDLDDVIQEGYLAYYKSRQKYPGVTDAPHRMALFKTVFMNRLHDMANSRTRSVPEVFASDMDPLEGLTFLERVAAEPDISEVLPMLEGAPEYVRKALALYATEEGLVRLRSRYRQVKVGKHLRRETLNERLCRLTGYDPAETNITGGIMACLRGS